MLCPSCGTEAPDDLPECAICGQVLLKEAEPEPLTELAPELLEEVEPEPPPEEAFEGLERTRFDASPPARVELLPGFESTAIAEEGFPPPDEAPLEIEPTQVRSPAGATPAWEGTLPGFDAGREIDDGLRTPAAAEVSICVWCGAQAKGVFCESCGHRRAASERPAPQDGKKPAEAEAVLCPACFARAPPYHDDVRGIDRCGECGVPLPPQDIL
jgi:hypothetical protein